MGWLKWEAARRKRNFKWSHRGRWAARQNVILLHFTHKSSLRGKPCEKFLIPEATVWNAILASSDILVTESLLQTASPSLSGLCFLLDNTFSVQILYNNVLHGCVQCLCGVGFSCTTHSLHWQTQTTFCCFHCYQHSSDVTGGKLQDMLFFSFATCDLNRCKTKT